MKKESIENNPILKLTFEFALETIKYCEVLEERKKYILSRQLLKSGTSIGANSREAQNAESKGDFIHKFKIAAKEVDETTAPQLYNIVQELAQRAQLPMPRVYLIDEQQPNAFATGRNAEHAAVAATTGIMSVLTERELRGVMAHELGHIKHRDILISTISATIAGAISALANFAVFFGG